MTVRTFDFIFAPLAVHNGDSTVLHIRQAGVIEERGGAGQWEWTDRGGLCKLAALVIKLVSLSDR